MFEINEKLMFLVQELLVNRMFECEDLKDSQRDEEYCKLQNLQEDL